MECLVAKQHETIKARMSTHTTDSQSVASPDKKPCDAEDDQKDDHHPEAECTVKITAPTDDENNEKPDETKNENLPIADNEK